MCQRSVNINRISPTQYFLLNLSEFDNCSIRMYPIYEHDLISSRQANVYIPWGNVFPVRHTSSDIVTFHTGCSDYYKKKKLLPAKSLVTESSPSMGVETLRPEEENVMSSYDRCI